MLQVIFTITCLVVVWQFEQLLDGRDVSLVESSLFKLSNNNKKIWIYDKKLKTQDCVFKRSGKES